MTMHRYNGLTIPEEGLYAGKLYTEEERAEIRRRNCLTNGQRKQEAQEEYHTGRGYVMLVCILPILLCVLGTIVEFALLH